MQTQHYDIIIIGGGPAGMTAGIYGARAGLKVLILESNITGGLVNSTHTVENFPSYPTIHGMELMEKMREHVDSLGITVEEVCEIEKLELTDVLKKVHCDEASYTSRAIILATGRKPIGLDTPTECEQSHFCAICDGGAYKGKSVLIVGGGNSAFDESLYLLGMGVEKLTLVEKMPRYFAAQNTQDMLFASDKVTGHTHTVVRDLLTKDGILQKALLYNEASQEDFSVDVDGIFVFLGQSPNNELFAKQIALTEQGYIPVDAYMRTSLPGVFAAGDIVDKPFRQISTAVADGTVAALAVEQYLRTVK